MISPLVSFSVTHSAVPAVGGIVTVTDYAGRQLCARLNRWEHGNAWITVIGLAVPQPYDVGDRLTLPQSQVIDWD